MWRASVAVAVLLSTLSAAHAQQPAVDPAFDVAIDQVCKPYVVDEVSEGDIAVPPGTSVGGGSYQLSPIVYVRLDTIGMTRTCTVRIGGGDLDLEPYRAAMMDAATRWTPPLEYRGDIPASPGYVRRELLCPTTDAHVFWMLLTRETGSRLTLAIAGGASQNC